MEKQSFNIMAFPAGPLCNLNCSYCYYLAKADYFQECSTSMSLELLEVYIKAYFQAHSAPVITFGWQGGEPSLRGLSFYEKAVELQHKHCPEGKQVQNSFQTNGILLDDNWCKFFHENDFLVGVSLDGPRRLHDLYRRDRAGNGSFNRVMETIERLREWDIAYNILAVISKENSKYPQEVYDFYQSIQAQHLQFIPLVESGERVAIDVSVSPSGYASFLIAVFNQWLKEGFGEVFIQVFEEALRVHLGYPTSLCIFSKECGEAMVMEHNGDLYVCDHFVYPEYRLGNIQEQSISNLVNSKRRREFGQAKYANLPAECLACPVLSFCYGGCPKNRIAAAEEGRMINYLCAGYKRFFTYIIPYLEIMGEGLKKQMGRGDVQNKLISYQAETWSVGRNDPCPCLSGKKYKRCCLHMRR